MAQYLLVSSFSSLKQLKWLCYGITFLYKNSYSKLSNKLNKQVYTSAYNTTCKSSNAYTLALSSTSLGHLKIACL